MKASDQFPDRQSESETSDYAGHFNASDRLRLMSQGILNYGGQIASALSSLVLVPFMLMRLGAEAYGFWIVALATPAFVAGLDSALSLAVTRESAQHHDADQINDESTSLFLSACCGVYFVFGLVCGLLVVATGIKMAPHLHLSPTLQSATPTVFAAVATGFAAGRAVTFATGVLAGFQRFGTINAISVGGLVCRFSGFVLLLMRHTSLGAIALWYAVVALAECLVALSYAYRLGAVRADRSLLQWRRLNRSVDFGLSSFLTSELLNLCNFGPAILIGLLGGGARATMTLYAGQRPSYIVSELNWKAGEVLFSESASKEMQKGNEAYAQLMIFGTTWLLAVAMPLCIGLFILAPVLVSVWLRTSSPEIIAVMRLTSIGAIADALWVGPLHTLWGRGLARRVLLITAGVTASVFLLNFLLIPRFGASGAAFAFTTSTCLGAIVTMIAAATEVDSSWIRLLFASFIAVALPSVCLAASTLTTAVLLRDHPKLLLMIAFSVGGIVYVSLFLVCHRFRTNSRRT
jgi:O-antigen/teichoic acid export membrane protein